MKTIPATRMLLATLGAVGLAAVALPAGAADAAKTAPAKTHATAHAGMAGMHDMSIRLSVADGAVLTTRPTSVRFEFVPAMRLRTVALSNAAGERIPVTFDGKAKAAAVVVTFAALEPDSYTLAFSADAGDHDMPGRVRFTVK
ncbi:MAG: copper resistance protein CopC [Alphaproteobacteria bacterium]|nr:copper resistance protein CopC [Alphaproteobacteria bacterium]